MKKKEYEVPLTTYSEVELEQGFMKASVFEDGTENANGVTIEEHGFASPYDEYGNVKSWEGDYSGSSWD